jgi:hypothetical protein
VLCVFYAFLSPLPFCCRPCPPSFSPSPLVAPFSHDAVRAAATQGKAAAISDDAASSMLEKGKANKNRTKDIGIQA